MTDAILFLVRPLADLTAIPDKILAQTYRIDPDKNLIKSGHHFFCYFCQEPE